MLFTEDDITLSQIWDAIKKEEELIDGMLEINFGNKFDMNIDIRCPHMLKCRM